MRRAAPVTAPVTEPPRCLRVRDEAVWSLAPGDKLAGARWKAAANRWRSEAHDAGLSNAEVWRALPAGRFLPGSDPERLGWMLESAGCTQADVPTLAAEAESLFGFVFDPMWQHGATSPDANWHLRNLRARYAQLGQA